MELMTERDWLWLDRMFSLRGRLVLPVYTEMRQHHRQSQNKYGSQAWAARLIQHDLAPQLTEWVSARESRKREGYKHIPRLGAWLSSASSCNYDVLFTPYFIGTRAGISS